MNLDIVFLVSGQGGNLRFVLEAQRCGLLPGRVVDVIADRDCGAVASARAAGIPLRIVRYAKDHPEELAGALQPYSKALIVTNIHRILPPAMVSAHAGRMLNLHYSLLPAFKGMIGMATVEAALEAGCTLIGSSAHLVTEQLDAGPILAQGALPIVGVGRERLIELTFRNGCLVLLNAIRRLAAPRTETVPPSFSPEFGLLSPGPDYDISGLDQRFWERIKDGKHRIQRGQ